MAAMPWPGAVAVSGGADSLSLMHLLADWAKASKRAPPLVLSVDHGLRPGSAKDARQVAAWARAIGLKAHVLTHKGAAPGSDIEAAARQARYALMGKFLARHKLAALYVGHTQGDQAETLLLRLARGSGLDGLAAMTPLAPFPQPGFAGLQVARPLLGLARAEVRADLARRGQPWLEDPMNSDTRFARTRMRALLPALEEAGLSPQRIADAAAHLARARAALELASEAVLARAVVRDGPRLLLDARALAAAPRELGLRSLATLLMAVSGQAYRPRFEALERLFDRLAGGGLAGGATLHGCRLAPAPRRWRHFGPQTLVLTPEGSRRSGAPVLADPPRFS
jgi:tRNA(Ile)-lysidine synthase